MLREAKLWKRNNGGWGASCGDVQDTGHHIIERSGKFTVLRVSEYGEETRLCYGVSRVKAEKAIAEDWAATPGD